MKGIININPGYVRLQKNDVAFLTASLLLTTVKKLIKMGLTINKIGFDSCGVPKIEIKEFRNHRILQGAVYLRASDGGGAYQIWQRMMDGCRVEWVTRH